MKIFQTSQIWTKLDQSVKYIFLIGSFSTPFRPFSIQPGASMIVWTNGSNYALKLSINVQPLSHYLMTPNIKIDSLLWWEKDYRTNRRKLCTNWPPRIWNITMNSQVICVFNFSTPFFQPNRKVKCIVFFVRKIFNDRPSLLPLNAAYLLKIDAISWIRS